jgi:DNA modification methylase
MDSIFGRQGQFNNEIIWQRTTTKSDYKQGAVNLPRVHDVILMYYKSLKVKRTFHQPFVGYRDEYVKKSYRHKDENGRFYTLGDLTAPGHGLRGHPKYEFMGITRHWRYSKEKMEELLAEGRIIQAKPGAVPRYKRYLDEMEGTPIVDVWDDIGPVQGQSKEYLGYPTQKPLALLERIIKMSTNEGDIVLDPFCGCGTAVHAAQRLGRRWIGIDISYHAIDLIDRRLRSAFPEIQFEILGKPRDLEPHQGKKKGADHGIDGIGYFADVQDGKAVTRRVVMSVKGGKEKNVTPDMLCSLVAVREQSGAEIGLFVSFKEPTSEMERIVSAAGMYHSGNGLLYPRIQILTVDKLLKGERPKYPDMSLGQETFKSAPIEKPENEQKKLF